MNSLQVELQRIAAEFVSGALNLMRQASLADLAGQPKNGGAPARTRALMTPVRNVRGQAKSVRAQPAPAPKQEVGKRHRATAEEIKRYKDLAFSTAKQMPPGFSKGELMRRTGGKVDMSRFLGMLVEEGLLTRKGERRNARYWVK